MASRAAGLAEVVRAAALHDSSLDTGGVLWLEHVNLVVGNRAQAEHFYIAFLGCTADPSPSFHCNLGRQQFHLSEGDAQLHWVWDDLGTLSMVEQRGGGEDGLSGLRSWWGSSADRGY